jgi:4-hydroxybenzoate polyprenyltransferase
MMSTIFRRFTDFLIFSNLYIAVAAVLMTVEAQIQLGMRPDWHPYLFLILFATLFEYNSHKFVAVFFYKHALLENKFSWIAGNLKLFYFIVFASVLGFIVAACFAKWEVLLALFPLGALTVLYSFPVYKKGVKIFRLREIPLLKIFIISLVWAATCIVLPLVQAGLKVHAADLALLIFERFLFIFAITVPFDVRDMESDKRSDLKTLPLMIGEKKAMLSANVAIVLFTALTACHYARLEQYLYLAAFFLSGVSTLYFLNSKKTRELRHYHYGILDGTMALQGLLVLLAWYLYSLQGL